MEMGCRWDDREINFSDANASTEPAESGGESLDSVD